MIMQLGGMFAASGYGQHLALHRANEILKADAVDRASRDPTTSGLCDAAKVEAAKATLHRYRDYYSKAKGPDGTATIRVDVGLIPRALGIRPVESRGFTAGEAKTFALRTLDPRQAEQVLEAVSHGTIGDISDLSKGPERTLALTDANGRYLLSVDLRDQTVIRWA